MPRLISLFIIVFVGCLAWPGLGASLEAPSSEVRHSDTDLAAHRSKRPLVAHHASSRSHTHTERTWEGGQTKQPSSPALPFL